MSVEAEVVRPNSFIVTYTGPEVDAGRMDARTLGPAMFAVAKLLEHSAEAIHGSGTNLKVEVGADFRKGSFAFELFASPPDSSVITQGALAFGITATAITALLKNLGVVRGMTPNAIEFVKWLHGKEVTSTEEDGDNIVVRVAGETELVVKTAVYKLAQNRPVREDMKEIALPLMREGIESVALGDVHEGATIKKSDLAAYEPPPPPEAIVQQSETEEVVEVVQLSFRGGNKWKFSQGDDVYWASILDTKFWKGVESHEVQFGKGDALRVRMRKTVTQSSAGLRVEREIVDVVEQLTPPEQLDLIKQQPAAPPPGDKP